MICAYIPFILYIFLNIKIGFLVLLYIILLLSLLEFYTIFNMPLKYITISISLCSSLYVYIYSVMLDSRNIFSYPLGLSILFSILLYIFFLTIDKILFVFDKRIFYRVLYLYLLSVFYIFIPVLINLFFTVSNTGLNIFLYQIVTCKVADSGALIVGKKYGRIKLAYNISPNKTVEGFIGSVITGFMLSIAFYFISPDFRKVNFLLHLFVGLIMIVLNNIGDLFESFLKRINNVKDSSTILFGIGGILDLIDGILPSTYLMLLYYNFLNNTLL